MSDSEISKKKGMSHAGDVLQTLLRNSKSPLSEQFMRWRLWNSWSDVVGPEIAKYTLPVGFLKGTLYVWVNNSSRMQELTFLVKPIKDKINQFANHCGWQGRQSGWIRLVRFTMDRKSVPVATETVEDLRGYLSKQSPNEDGEPQPDR